MASAKIFRINYKSDFILTLESDAGWMTPFCIKFWTGTPSQAYYVGWDGETYTHCSFDPSEPTKLLVQFDDHHLPIGDLKFQVAYHFTVADFPNDTEDEVINPANITTEIDGETYQVMLDFTGETAPEIQFALPAYANEAQRIDNEQQRIAAETQRIANEETRIQHEESRIAAEQTRQQNEQQRINQEQARVNEYASLKADAVAATGAANDAAALANQKAQLAADKAALAQDAADLANAKALLAADKAALAASAAQLANDKAALAQQKAEYAQTQGGYAKDQGDYAKDKGDICSADHLVAVADHGIAVDDHTQAGNDHTRAESDHGIAVDDHTQAGNDHTRAESDHGIAADDHTQAGTDHQTAAADHQTATADHTHAGNDHTRAESDHTRAESDHAAVEVYVDSLGAFDISAYHATGGVLAKYADLTAALGTNGANVPDALRKGGMSVKFVQSSDNKYVQYRLKSKNFSINVNEWENINESIEKEFQLLPIGGYELNPQIVREVDNSVRATGRYVNHGIPLQISLPNDSPYLLSVIQYNSSNEAIKLGDWGLSESISSATDYFVVKYKKSNDGSLSQSDYDNISGTLSITLNENILGLKNSLYGEFNISNYVVAASVSNRAELKIVNHYYPLSLSFSSGSFLMSIKELDISGTPIRSASFATQGDISSDAYSAVIKFKKSDDSNISGSDRTAIDSALVITKGTWLDNILDVSKKTQVLDVLTSKIKALSLGDVNFNISITTTSSKRATMTIYNKYNPFVITLTDSDYQFASYAKNRNGDTIYGTSWANKAEIVMDAYSVNVTLKKANDGSLTTADLLKMAESITFIKNNMPPKVYVATNGNDTTGNGSESAPFATIKKALSVSNVVILNPGTYSEAIIITDRDNIKIYGNATKQNNDDITKISNTNYGIVATKCNGLEIDGIIFENIASHCGRIIESQNVVIKNCQFNNSGTQNGLTFEKTDAVVISCHADSNYNDGFNIHNAGDVVFINCTGNNNGGDGLSHHEECTGAVIGGYWNNNGKAGISTPTYGANVQISDAFCSGNTYGMQVYGGDDVTENTVHIKVSGVVFENNSTAGIQVDKYIVDLVNCIFKGNTADKLIVSGTINEYNTVVINN